MDDPDVPSLEYLRTLLGLPLTDPFVRYVCSLCDPDETSNDVDLERRYYCAPNLGFDIVYECKRCVVDAIFLYGGDNESYVRFAGRLLAGIAFGCSRQCVREVLGEPSRASGPVNTELGQYGPWDRYDAERWSIHFSYRYGDDSLNMITLMNADARP